MTNKPSHKNARDPATITPEYILQQRLLREQRKQREREEKGLNDSTKQEATTPPHLRFQKREMLQVNDPIEDKLKVKIMSYNVLAQCLIRRELFPTSGNILKWSIRSQVLMSEFKHYDADIMCLQELDHVQYKSFWHSELEKLGYQSKYYRNTAKGHGVAIFFKKSMFVWKHQSAINYDNEEVPQGLEPRTITQNIGLIVQLDFTSIIRKKYKLSKAGVIIGTTHLFWHPFGTFERTRQTYLVLKKIKDFTSILNSVSGTPRSGYYTFFAGDLNSQPFDSPYLSITAKPIEYSGRSKLVISCSLSYRFSKNRGKTSNESIEGGITHVEDPEDPEFGSDNNDDDNVHDEKHYEGQPKDPVPESFEASEEQLELVQKIQDVHNSLDMRAISVYASGYRHVHPENSGRDNDRFEPYFSNWAHTWRGLLDYILVVCPWDKTREDHSKRVDTTEELQENQLIRLLKLLRLPQPEEMGSEPSGQPRSGQYPSDHLCLMAEVQLL
ncbi:uncharacterized protein KQ657_004710 [Scheffersomyces spartinae]|uniref:Endonuclease/exonuclease/phosphatase domain-containing protein n=1 Tax=Scheffersomyces spartinae TaxID=45513 RepID=A0A9P7VB19_9ASCO|nr:uncharacterized protein KQ657_004710 [Scheffersomyces spartinae]KAG7194495.1 hypothetical protein KQ657_004710 [Scheffersomyces spartinae]